MEEWIYLNEDIQKEMEFRNIISEIKNLKISSILAHHGVRLARQDGNEIKALCPFHMDEHLGSFSINDRMGICKCFACGGGGDAIHSFMQMTGMEDNPDNYQKAVLQLAADEGIITQDKFEELSNTKYSSKFINDMTSSSVTVKGFVNKKKKLSSSEQTLYNTVYQCMKEFFGLTEEHRRYLKEVRLLSDAQIERDYFSMSNDRKKKNQFVRIFKEKHPELMSSLQSVPGFYAELRNYGVKDMPVIKSLEWCVYDGIGILIRDAENNIRGIQIRKESPGDGPRYVWFSSKFAIYANGCEGGAAVQAPIDVLLPQSQKKVPCICIAEGRFKTEIISQWGNVALSVQGVGNFEGIDRDITAVREKLNLETRDVFVFYDADMLRNTAVFAQALKLGQYLEESLEEVNVKYCIWHEKLGKGIDDLYIQSHETGLADIRTFDFEYLNKVWSTAVLELFAKYSIKSIASASKSVRMKFTMDLKTELERELFS